MRTAIVAGSNVGFWFGVLLAGTAVNALVVGASASSS
jgi:hypothetical protein